LASQKKFLLFAIVVGIAGVVIGTATFLSSITELFQP
jgi:hypothetical protein